jgi:ABC-type microcin C transport system permease subunit YejB
MRPSKNQNLCPELVPTKLRASIAIGLFVLLASYVSFSSIRLGILLWQRFG